MIYIFLIFSVVFILELYKCLVLLKNEKEEEEACLLKHAWGSESPKQFSLQALSYVTLYLDEQMTSMTQT